MTFKQKISNLEAKLASQPFTDEEKKKLYAWEDEGSYYATAPAGFYWMEVRLSKQSGKYHVDLFERKSLSGTFKKTESKVKNTLQEAMDLGNNIAESFINDEEMRVASNKKLAAKIGKHAVTITITSKNTEPMLKVMELLKKYEHLEGDESVDWEMTS